MRRNEELHSFEKANVSRREMPVKVPSPARIGPTVARYRWRSNAGFDDRCRKDGGAAKAGAAKVCSHAPQTDCGGICRPHRGTRAEQHDLAAIDTLVDAELRQGCRRAPRRPHCRSGRHSARKPKVRRRIARGRAGSGRSQGRNAPRPAAPSSAPFWATTSPRETTVSGQAGTSIPS